MNFFKRDYSEYDLDFLKDVTYNILNELDDN